MPISFKWSDEYLIGVPEIDAQHQHLFELADQLETDLSSQNVKRIIMELYKYTRIHFDSEEKLMLKIAYPKKQAHTALHNDLLETLNKVSKQDFTERLAITTLRMFVYNWLVEHIQHEDKQIGSYVNT